MLYSLCYLCIMVWLCDFARVRLLYAALFLSMCGIRDCCVCVLCCIIGSVFSVHCAIRVCVVLFVLFACCAICVICVFWLCVLFVFMFFVLIRVLFVICVICICVAVLCGPGHLSVVCGVFLGPGPDLA